MKNPFRKINLGKVVSVMGVTLSIFCFYTISSVYADSLSNNPSLDPHAFVAFAKQDITINGTVQTAPVGPFPGSPSSSGFQIAVDNGTNNRTTGVTTYDTALFASVAADSKGFVQPGLVAAAPGLRTTDTIPQNRIIVSGQMAASTNYIAGPDNTVLKDATITCRGGSVVTTQNAVTVNGKVTIGMPLGENDCKVTYNFEDIGTTSGGGSYDGSSGRNTNMIITPLTREAVIGTTANFSVSATTGDAGNGGVGLGVVTLRFDTGYYDNWGFYATNAMKDECGICVFTPDHGSYDTAGPAGSPRGVNSILSINTTGWSPGAYRFRVNAIEGNTNFPTGVSDAYGNEGITYASQYITVTVTDPPVMLSVHTPSIAADPVGAHGGSVFQNGKYELKWTTATANQAECWASGNWNGSKAIGSGSEDRSIDTSTIGLKTYKLTCTRPGYNSDMLYGFTTDTVYVQVNPAPSKCDINAVGTNKLVGCVWSWDTTAANAAGVSFGSAPNIASQFWSLAGQAPNGNTMTSPVADTATAIDQDWGNGGPNGLTDKFFVVWKGSFDFKNSGYVFTGASDDGNAVYVDNNKIVDDWSNHGYRTLDSNAQTLNAGTHPVQLFFYDDGGSARASLSWRNPSAAPVCGASGQTCCSSGNSCNAGLSCSSSTNTCGTVVTACTSASLYASPNPIVINSSSGVTTVYASATCLYDIRVNSPSGDVFASPSGLSSVSKTDNWVNNGTMFYQQKRGDTTAAGTLATLRVDLSSSASSAPTVSLAATPSSMTLPTNSTVLSWTTTGNPDSCDASNAWSATNIHNGDPVTYRSGMTQGAYIYDITCHKAGYADAFSRVIVTVAGSLLPTAPTFSFNPTRFDFDYTIGGPTIQLQNSLQLTNTGDAPLNFYKSTNASWCILGLYGAGPYTVAPGSSLNFSVMIDATDASVVSPGTYNCNLIFADPAATNNPQSIPVRYVVSGAPPPVCGASGQTCCSTGNSCNAGLSCSSSTNKCGTPPSCGGFGQACCSTGSTCTGSLICSGSNTCVPPPSTYELIVSPKPTGGYVKSDDTRINCGNSCTQTYPKDSNVTLRATPESSLWKFVGWTGACSGTNPVCVVSVGSNVTVSASFSKRPLIYQEF